MDLTKSPMTPQSEETPESPLYYAMISGERRGPFGLDRLVEEGVRPQTYVWCRGMADWEKAEDVADICRYFRIRLHDLMHPGSPSLPVQSSESVDDQGSGTPSRMSGFIEDGDLPSVEEVSQPANPDRQPPSMIGLGVFATIVFPFLGWLALRSALESRKAWRANMKREAHDLCASAKMWAGISLFVGLIVWATVLRNI